MGDRWNYEDYRTENETPEVWQLKKEFVATYKDEIPEDELVSLACLVVNVEVLGCIYPPQTMKRVKELSEDLVKNFRLSRRDRLKRYSVDASEAAYSKILKLDKLHMHSEDICEEDENNNQIKAIISIPVEIDIIEVDPFISKYGRIVIYDDHRGSSTMLDILKASKQIWIKERFEQRKEDKLWQCQLFIKNILVGTGAAVKKEDTKKLALEDALVKLQEFYYTVRLRSSFVVPKKNHLTTTTKKKPNKTETKKIDETAFEMQLLKSLGWQGGYAESKGIVDSIGLTVKVGKSGFGSIAKFDETNYKNLLQKYKETAHLFDLIFTDDFTNGERTKIHKLATKTFNFKAKTITLDNKERQMTVTKNRTLFDIAKSLFDGKTDPHYELIAPSTSTAQ